MAEATAKPKLADAELRRSFRKYESAIAFDNARRAAVFAGIFMLAGASLDWVIIPGRALDFLLIRATCAVCLGLIFWYLGRARHTTQTSIVSQGIALLPLISICIMISVTEGGNSVYYAGLSLVLVGLSLLLRWTFWNSLVMILTHLRLLYRGRGAVPDGVRPSHPVREFLLPVRHFGVRACR